MKQLLFIACMFATFTSFCQVNSVSTKLSDRELGLAYQKKGSQLRIAGFCLLGGGVVLSAIGVNQSYDFWDDNNSGVALFTIGNAMLIASIPCFIGAAKNKGRAEILLRNENVPLSFKSITQYPAIAIAFQLPQGKTIKQ